MSLLPYLQSEVFEIDRENNSVLKFCHDVISRLCLSILCYVVMAGLRLQVYLRLIIQMTLKRLF